MAQRKLSEGVETGHSLQRMGTSLRGRLKEAAGTENGARCWTRLLSAGLSASLRAAHWGDTPPPPPAWRKAYRPGGRRVWAQICSVASGGEKQSPFLTSSKSDRLSGLQLAGTVCGPAGGPFSCPGPGTRSALEGAGKPGKAMGPMGLASFLRPFG